MHTSFGGYSLEATWKRFAGTAAAASAKEGEWWRESREEEARARSARRAGNDDDDEDDEKDEDIWRKRAERHLKVDTFPRCSAFSVQCVFRKPLRTIESSHYRYIVFWKYSLAIFCESLYI